MSRIDGNNARLLAVAAGKVLRHGVSVSTVVVDADKGRGNVCLLVEVCEAEAREAGGVV